MKNRRASQKGLKCGMDILDDSAPLAPSLLAAGLDHPPTRAYSSFGGMKLDGFEGAFGLGAGGEALRPALEADPLAARLARSGWGLVAGLWVPPGEARRSWAALAEREARLDASGWELQSFQRRRAGCDWKIFMEIYFDDYHVEPMHAGLSSLADCSRLSWLWEEQAQAQRVESSALSGSGSPAYAKLFELSRSIFGEDPVAAVWGALYPATMVEWLAGGLAVSSLEPDGPGASWNRVAFAYPAGLASARPDFVAAHQAAYWETALEDDEIGERIQKGRDALSRAGRDESGPACPHLEDGIVHFHRWLAAWSRQESIGNPRGGAAQEGS
jgi:hypothetical protein